MTIKVYGKELGGLFNLLEGKDTHICPSCLAEADPPYHYFFYNMPCPSCGVSMLPKVWIDDKVLATATATPAAEGSHD